MEMPSAMPLLRFLRQTTELRESTHAGMLTTANLRDALGFSEPEAAKVLGHRSQVRLVHLKVLCGLSCMLM
jgi:hypothetical protein